MEIINTCCCGARFEISSTFEPEITLRAMMNERHDEFLKAHEDCVDEKRKLGELKDMLKEETKE